MGRAWQVAGAQLAIACAFDSSGLGTADAGETASGPDVTTMVTTETSTVATETSTTTTSSASSEETAGSTTLADTSTGADSSSSSGGETGEALPPVGPFGEPVPITMLNTAFNEDDPTVRGDFLEIYFASDRGGGLGFEDIWRATRVGVVVDWDPPLLVTELSSQSVDGTPELSSDGLTMFLASDRPGGSGSFDLYVSERASLVAQWVQPMRVTELATTTAEAGPTLSPDLLELIYCTSLGSADLLGTTRPGVGIAWLAATPLAEINDAAADDCSPFLLADGVHLAFASSRLGGLGFGNLWYATRDGGLFVDPMPIEGVNDPAYDDDPWLSADGGLVVFASNRVGGGTFDLWMADSVK